VFEKVGGTLKLDRGKFWNERHSGVASGDRKSRVGGCVSICPDCACIVAFLLSSCGSWIPMGISATVGGEVKYCTVGFKVNISVSHFVSFLFLRHCWGPCMQNVSVPLKDLFTAVTE